MSIIDKLTMGFHLFYTPPFQHGLPSEK